MKNEPLSDLIDSLKNWKTLSRAETLLIMAKIQDAIKREKPEQRIVAPTETKPE